MSAQLGIKLARTAYSVGQKLALAHSLGKALGVIGHSTRDTKGVSTDSTSGINNMIYNKSNLGDAQYLPFGVRKITGESKKKSYLEKR